MLYIHTYYIFQPADFGQRMSRASNSVVYARALWRSIRDSKSLGEGPDRSSNCTHCNWKGMLQLCPYLLTYVFYLCWTIIYIYFYRYLHPLHHLINRDQQIRLVTENLPHCVRYAGDIPSVIFGPWVRSWDCLTTRSTSFLLDFGNWRLELSSTSSVPKSWLENGWKDLQHCTAQGGMMRNICFVTFLWLQFFNHILCFPGMSGWSLEVLRRNASFPRCWCDSLQYSLCSSCGLPCFSCDLSEKMEKWSIPMGPWAGLKIDCPHDSLPTMLFPQFQT